jgi:uncharacterized membrane protein
MIIASSLILLTLDALFLYASSSFFGKQILDVQRTPLQINMIGAVACYIFLIFGLNYFILRERRSVLDAFLLGFVIYGVYETTSLALLKEWRLKTAMIDTLWGGILFATTTYLTYSFPVVLYL